MKMDLRIQPEQGSTASKDYSTAEKLLLDEEFFHQLLSLERKRTERSGSPSLLMLIDLRNFSENSKRAAVFRDINQMLSYLLRETDIKGWYRVGSVAGVIFTEMGDSDLIEAKDRILCKFRDGLKSRISPEIAENVIVYFEFLTKRKAWNKNGNSLVKLGNYSETPQKGLGNSFVQFLKSFTGSGVFIAIIDLLLISVAHFLSVCFRFGQPTNFLETHPGAYALSLTLFLLSLYIFDLYNLERALYAKRIPFRITLSAVLAVSLSAMFFYLVPQWQYGRGILAVQAGLVWAFLISWRLLYCKISHLSKAKIPTLVLGWGEIGKAALQLLKAPHSPFEAKGFLDEDPSKAGSNVLGLEVIGPIAKMGEIIPSMGIKAVILAVDLNSSLRISRKILEARLGGTEVIDMPGLYERIGTRLPIKYVEDQWFVFAEGFSLISKEYVQKFKRILDFAFSGLMLFASIPLMVLTALAIRLDSPGPVFYKQQRVGKGCKIFTVYKFRSMRSDAEQQGAKWAQKRDPRVTRVGKWIRMFRIDELPQIWNVFTGEMSLVGPRPERPEFVKELDLHIPYYCMRHTVAPGITGWAQIMYPYGASVEDAYRKLEYDLYYIKNMSILFDMKVLLRTVGVVIMGEGAR